MYVGEYPTQLHFEVMVLKGTPACRIIRELCGVVQSRAEQSR
jgi:hypothetical protein